MLLVLFVYNLMVLEKCLQAKALNVEVDDTRDQIISHSI
jgi:hypothetical protein